MMKGNNEGSRGGMSKAVGVSCDEGIRRSKEMKTQEINENIAHLRKALFHDDGKDKDVTTHLAPVFLQYTKNGLQCSIELSSKLSKDQTKWAFEMTKDRMENMYEESDYGWDDDDKMDELSGDGARFLLVRDIAVNSESIGEVVGFAHFRFTVKGEIMEMMTGDTCISIWDIQLEDKFQRKGLGRHLLTIIELIGLREGIKNICVPIQLADEGSKTWLLKSRGYAPDTSLPELCGFESSEEGYEIYTKSLQTKPKQTTSVPLTPMTIDGDKTAAASSPTSVIENDLATTLSQASLEKNK